MHKFTAMYTTPDDPRAFLDHYESTHMEIVRRWPNVKEIRTTRFTGTPRGGEPDVFLQTDVLFEDEDAMMESLRSDPGRESGRDAMQMVERFGTKPTMLLGEET